MKKISKKLRKKLKRQAKRLGVKRNEYFISKKPIQGKYHVLQVLRLTEYNDFFTGSWIGGIQAGHITYQSNIQKFLKDYKPMTRG